MYLFYTYTYIYTHTYGKSFYCTFCKIPLLEKQIDKESFVHFLRKHNSNKCILIKECLDIETKKQDKNNPFLGDNTFL